MHNRSARSHEGPSWQTTCSRNLLTRTVSGTVARTRRSAATLAIALAAFASGCDSIYFPADGQPAGLAFSLNLGSPAQAFDAGDAFDAADHAHVRVLRDGGVLLDTTLALSAPGATRSAELRLELRRQLETLDLEVSLELAGEALFEGVSSVTLHQGQTSTVELSLVPVVAAILIDPLPPVISIGDQFQLTGAAVFATGDTVRGVAVTWSSLDPGVLAVSPNGTAIVMAEGEARVMGQAGARSMISTLQIRATVESLEIDGADAVSLITGEEIVLVAVAHDPNGNTLNRRAEWRSTASGTASVDLTGRVRALNVGQATIIATLGPRSDSVVLTVLPAAVASVTVEPAQVTLDVGANLTLRAILRSASGEVLTGRVVTWTTSDARVAVVDPLGQVEARSAGTVRIRAASEGVFGEAVITVRAPVTSLPARVAISPDSVSIALGSSLKLTATAYDASGNPMPGKSFQWASSNPVVASVLQDGTVNGLANGSATITATTDGIAGKATVTVKSLQPDLIITTGAPKATPSSVAPGASLSLSGWTVRNQGTAPSGFFTNGFYLSKDASISATDYYLDGNGNYSLAPGESFNWGGPTLTIPAGVSPGTYYVGILVDNTNAAPESNEANNWVSVPITVTTSQPDLVFGAVPSPTSLIIPGALVTFSALTVENVGTGPAPTFEIAVYLSPDDRISTTDSLLAVFSVRGGLVPGSSYTVPQPEIIIPAGVKPGTWFVGIAIDPSRSVGELNQGNNLAVLPITIQPIYIAVITVSPKSVNVAAGSRTVLTATAVSVSGAPVFGLAFIWASSNNSVATVSGGQVTAVSPGIVTVTATAGGKSGAAAVTVTSTSPDPAAVASPLPNSYRDSPIPPSRQ